MCNTEYLSLTVCKTNLKSSLSTHILDRLQRDFNPIVPHMEKKRPATITQLIFVENLPPITGCNIPLIETPERNN